MPNSLELAQNVDNCLNNLCRYTGQALRESEALAEENKILKTKLETLLPGCSLGPGWSPVSVSNGSSTGDGPSSLLGYAKQVTKDTMQGVSTMADAMIGGPAAEKAPEGKSPWDMPRPPDALDVNTALDALAQPTQNTAIPGSVKSPRETSDSDVDTSAGDRKNADVIGEEDDSHLKMRPSQDFHTKEPVWRKMITNIGESAEHHFESFSLAAMRIGMIGNSESILQKDDKDDTEDSQTIQKIAKKLQKYRGATFLGFDTSSAADPIAIRIARSFTFKLVAMLAIFFNTVWLGVAANQETKLKYEKLESGDYDRDLSKALDYPEYVFTVWFTLELLIRLCAEGVDFVKGTEKAWNLIDSFLVTNSYVQMALQSNTNLSFIRVLRVFRLARVVKVIKAVPFLKNLRTMVFSILNSFLNLLWALLVMILEIFMFSLFFQYGIIGYVDDAAGGSDAQISTAGEMKDSFGTLFDTMVALVASVTGGNDWMMYATLLRECKFGEVYLLAFIFYICFTVVGLLNVVTGIFVDSAVCTRTEDEVVETWRAEHFSTVETLRSIFKAGDVDESGSMTLKEFRAHLLDPWVRAYFSGLEIDPSDAVSIFTLIAREDSDEVNIDEFVAGVMKLKGHAKSVDVLTLMYDSARQTAQLNKFMNYVEEQLGHFHPSEHQSDKLESISGLAVGTRSVFKSKFRQSMGNTPFSVVKSLENAPMSHKSSRPDTSQSAPPMSPFMD
jgi:hypothetical protein